MYVRMCMHMYPCMYVCVCVCICLHIYVYACMRVYAYMHMCILVCIYTSPHMFMRRVCMHLQVLLSTLHVQVCTLDRCCEHQRTHLLHARYRMCICAIYIHVYMHIFMCRCVCMHVYIFVCMYACTCICVYEWMYIYVYVYVHVYAYIYICICMCVYIHMYLYITCMCSLFHLALGNEDGGVQLVYESAWGSIFDRRKDSGVVCVFSIFDAGGSVCGRMCVHTYTHTHAAQIGYSVVSPGVGMKHLEGPKNPDGLILGIHIFVYVYKVHMCIYMLRGGMRSWTNCFFLLTCLFF